MVFRGEMVAGFSFSQPILEVLLIKPLLIGLGKDPRGRTEFVSRVVVNGVATVPKPIEKRHGQFYAGALFNDKTYVLDL